MKQVDKTHYDFNKYCGPDRWSSYYYQLREVLAKNPKNILEVGGGDGVLKNYIRSNTEINYKNLDVAEDLNPDALGSVIEIPFEDNEFDLACAFEVLEHLPFEDFEKALLELRRVSKSSVILSLPHFGPMLSFSFKIPFLREKRISFKIPFPKTHVFNGEHYWEIGKKSYGPNKIKDILNKYFEVEKDFILYENPYHHFYILKNKQLS